MQSIYLFISRLFYVFKTFLCHIYTSLLPYIFISLYSYILCNFCLIFTDQIRLTSISVFYVLTTPFSQVSLHIPLIPFVFESLAHHSSHISLSSASQWRLPCPITKVGTTLPTLTWQTATSIIIWAAATWATAIWAQRAIWTVTVTFTIISIQIITPCFKRTEERTGGRIETPPCSNGKLRPMRFYDIPWS